tara:strand:+ start:733 stop:921 length:189 start_codon:yes stop_codon:yes gene_type:complete
MANHTNRLRDYFPEGEGRECILDIYPGICCRKCAYQARTPLYKGYKRVRNILLAQLKKESPD